MTSIIKVDQIQLANGSTPTAADLGLNVSGGILNVHHVTSSTQTKPSSSGAWIDTAFTKTVTPTSSSSKFFVTFAAGGLVNNVQYVGIRILRDSTEVSKNWSYHNRGETWNGIFNFAVQGLDEPSTNSDVTYKIQVYTSTNGNDYYFNYGGANTGIANMTIFEIAG